MPTTWVLFLVLVAVVAGLPLWFATLRSPLRGGLLIGHLGLLQIVPGVVVAPYSIPLFGGVTMTPANILVAGVLFTATLIVVIERDPIMVRLAVLVVLVAGALEVALVGTTDWALSSGAVLPFAGIEPSAYGASLNILLAGTPVVVAEVLLAVVLSERSRSLVPRRWATAVAGVTSLTVLLVLDGLAFTLMTGLLEPGLTSAMAGGVLRKLVLAVPLGVLLFVFLAARRPDGDVGRPLRLRDVVTVARRDLMERVAHHERERIQLVERTVTVAEEERHRLAQNLHDDAIQLFTAADLHLQRIRAGASGSDIATVQRLVRSGVGSLRRVILELSGPEVAVETFAPLVRTYLQRLEPDGGITLEVDVDLSTDVSDVVAAGAYRIVIEAMSNVVKHADATRVRVAAHVAAGVLHGEVEDDGTGIPPDASTGPGHLGLRAMRDRADALGGRVEVRALDGSGTRVTFALPVARDAAVRA